MLVPNRRKTLLAGLLVVIATAAVVSTGRLRSQPVKIRPVVIRGYLAVRVTGENITTGIAVKKLPRHDVYLPGIKVFLANAGTGNPVGAAVITDLSGRFSLPANGPERYKICWSGPGFGKNCAKDIVSVSNQNVFLSTVLAQPEKRDKTTVVFGRVQMKDGSAVRRLEPLANINAYAKVTVADNAGKEVGSVIVNNFGEYLLPAVPARDTILLRTSIEGGKGEQRILPDAKLGTVAFNPIDLVIGNTPPRVAPIVATDPAGRIVKNANPGSTITLKADASDADGDPLEFRWLLGTDAGTLSATSGPAVQWALPTRPGRYTVTVLAADGKGGYSDSSLSVLADGRGIPFSGHVAGTDAASLGGAQVEVNGQLAVTGAEGLFQLRVRDADRFVLNIHKPGYALVSQIYDRGITSGRWTMTRASVATVDPTRDNVLVNRRDVTSCPGTIADRFAKEIAKNRSKGVRIPVDVRKLPAFTAVQWQDGKSNVIAPGKLEIPPKKRKIEGCGPGIQVKLAANSLIDQRGNAPAGNVSVALSTTDLQSPDQMPGDYTVKVAGGDPKVMQSYGAGSVEITGPSGAHYNLKPGTTAEVTIPVDRSQLEVGAPLPPTIPILFYNEKQGVWQEEGSATLVGGDRYVATVKHFSNINCDTLKTDQACVRVLSPTLPASYDMEVTVPQNGGAAPKDISKSVSNTPYALYNLPLHKNIVLTPIRTDVNPHVPIGNFIVNTGDKQNPTVPNNPLAPYGACSTEVTLTQLTIPPEPISGEFLQGLSSFEASNLSELSASDPTLAAQLNASTDNYYHQIDPRAKRTTFADFKNTNDLNGPGELHAVYSNSGDLGFGRDMHCKRTGSDVACYVTNYGNILTDDAQDVIDAVGGPGHTPVATVAMEYSRIESQPGVAVEFDDPERVVKFYVYSGDGTHLLNAADLDSGVNARPRPVPQLCMVCHGGAYAFPWGPGTAPTFDSRDHVKLGATFLPFDLHYYNFAPAPNDKATQQPIFKQLNEDIVKNTPPGAALAEVITKMYTPGPNQNETFVADGWNAQPVPQNMYKDVVARTCRTCHIANSFPSLKFDQSTQMTDSLLGSVETRVCSQFVMPHAKVTHNIFWGSFQPSMPAQLQIFGDAFRTGLNGWQGNLCGPFTSGGITPPSFYTTVVQPIFNVNCTSCHNAGSPAAGLNLSAANSLANLVNVTSSEDGTKKRVLPGNANNSYLYMKVHGSPGISGVQMPKNQPPLSAADQASIQTWINGGANP